MNPEERKAAMEAAITALREGHKDGHPWPLWVLYILEALDDRTEDYMANLDELVQAIDERFAKEGW